MLNLGKRWRLMMVSIGAIIFLLGRFAVAEPLHEASKEGDYAKVKSLIEEGSDVNIADENGVTSLYFAADRGYKDMVELLISKGANINAVGRMNTTPLGWAEYYGHKDVAELLIKHGAHK